MKTCQKGAGRERRKRKWPLFTKLVVAGSGGKHNVYPPVITSTARSAAIREGEKKVEGSGDSIRSGQFWGRTAGTLAP